MEQTLAEKSYDYIRKKMTGGDLPPGKGLVNRVLAGEICVGVIPVREAIQRLAIHSWGESLANTAPSGRSLMLNVMTLSS